jgi:hypothetical protein
MWSLEKRRLEEAVSSLQKTVDGLNELCEKNASALKLSHRNQRRLMEESQENHASLVEFQRNLVTQT